jgi:hypothetical protein
MAHPDQLVCLDAGDGRVLWQRTVSAPQKVKTKSPQIGLTTPTPVCDGTHVWAATEPGTLACFAMDGMPKWSTSLKQFHSASPILAEGQILIGSNSSLASFCAEDGKPAWMADGLKPVDHGGGGAPGVMRLGETALALTPGGEAIRLRDGAVLARGLGQCHSSITPLVAGDLVFYNFGDGGYNHFPQGIQAVRLTLDGESVRGALLWRQERPRDTGSGLVDPVLYQGVIYHIARTGQAIWAWDALTGSPRELPKVVMDVFGHNFYPRPAVAGGCLYLIMNTGPCAIVRLGETAELAGMPDLVCPNSSPFFAGGRMYVRTLEGVLCLGSD